MTNLVTLPLIKTEVILLVVALVAVASGLTLAIFLKASLAADDALVGKLDPLEGTTY